MTFLIRGTVLSGVSDLVSELGGDPDALLRAHQLDASATEDFERFVRYPDTAAVLGDAARLLECPDFGMRLARRQSLQILGPLWLILRNGETVGDAVDGVCRFLHNIVPADTAALIRRGRTAQYSFDTLVRNDFDRFQMVEKSLALAMKGFTLMIGDDFVPLKVTFRHRRLADLDRYREVFKLTPIFGGETNSIHLPAGALTRPIPDRDPTALALAENYLTRIRPDLAVTDQVREVTRRLLLVGHASLVEVARAMSIHPRVLQRRLAEEGIAFEEILDEVRRATAWDLSATGIQVSQIARALGYAEQSSYSRACKRWYGKSPRELKAQRRGDVPGPPPPAQDALQLAGD